MVHVFFMLYVFIYVYWCLTRFTYHMTFLSFNSNTAGVTSGAGTVGPSGAAEFICVLWGSCCSCRTLFVLLSCCFWPFRKIHFHLGIFTLFLKKLMNFNQNEFKYKQKLIIHHFLFFFYICFTTGISAIWYIKIGG